MSHLNISKSNQVNNNELEPQIKKRRRKKGRSSGTPRNNNPKQNQPNSPIQNPKELTLINQIP